MKNCPSSYLLLGIVFLLLPIDHVLGQCANQVLHTTGTTLVSGVNVTATSSGQVDNYNSYCPFVTAPYFIGYNFGTGSGTGSFTFTFSPSINGIRLNFSGASCSGIDCEEIRLTINGAHYPMVSVGSNNACDPMAVLTGAGDLQGCGGCGVSGWSGTNITGFPISTLTVQDFVLGGIPNGSLFSLFICNGILPAEWLDFQAHLQVDETVALEWQTQTEINNDFFTVERSADGMVWEEIGVQKGAGNSNLPQAYGHIDRQPLVGESQYRIRQTSLDGAFTHSAVREVSRGALGGIHIAPNPAHDQVHIDMAGLAQAVVTLRNQLGQLIEVPRDLEGDQMTLHIADLASGVYFIAVRSSAKVYSQKLMVE
jgi:hypothetical protein